MSEAKRARPDYSIQDHLAARWSPYGFAPRPLSAAELRSLFEAARWAPSAFNEQPWRFLVARREDQSAFEELLSCLVEANQSWARNASVLVLSVVALTYARNGKPNGTALHDLGLAAASLTAEATSRGLVVHQMGGILPDRVREVYGVPAGYQPLTALAIGYAADPQELPADMRQRDETPRTRRPQAEFVFAGAWGKAAVLD